MFRLPPILRAPIVRYSPRLGRHRLVWYKVHQNKYATVHVGEEWNKTGSPSRTTDLKKTLPQLSAIVDIAKAVLDAHSTASDSEKEAVLNYLRDRVANPPTNARQKRALKQRVTAALTGDDPFRALYNAVRGHDDALFELGLSSSDPHDSAREYSAKKTDWSELLVEDASGIGCAGDAASFVPRDGQYIRAHMAMPTPEAYPNVEPKLFDLLSRQDPLLTIWQKYSAKPVHRRDFAQIILRPGSDFPSHIAARLPLGAHGCSIIAKLPADIQVSAVGAGVSKNAARAAAIMHAISKLHSKGQLQRLFDALIAQIDSRKPPEHGLVELEEVPSEKSASKPQSERKNDMPTKELYPDAPAELFDDVRAPVAVNSAVQKLGHTMRIDGSVITAGNGKCQYELRVDISDVALVTAIGQGHNKQLAKQDAWRAAIWELHVNGALKQLFPDPAVDTQVESGADHEDNLYEEADFVDVTEDVFEREKDGKVDIYNYAAGLGLLPVFQAENVKSKGRRRLVGRASQKQASVKVTISLPELDIVTSAVGDDLINAEIAAAVSFKRLAERKQESERNELVSGKSGHFSLLTVETASQFFEVYRSRQSQAKIEIEHEVVATGSAYSGHNSVKVLIDDAQIGPPGIMATKARAEAVAYLGAALELVKREPDLLDAFAEAMREGKGKVLRKIDPISVMIEASTLHVMRDTIVAARRAGLPDERQALTAEMVETSETRPKQRVLSRDEREAASERLLAALEGSTSAKTSTEPQNARSSLPVMDHRDDVINIVNNNVFSIIIGATGSGKTTQVPQIILDDAIQSKIGGFCDVICTQPRRLAASSIAQRVSVERNESLGKSVGYHVRFDSKRPEPGGSITYCTTGVLLEQLKHNPDAVLEKASHIVVDEVHERDVPTDFLLSILRRAIRKRQQASKHVPKVILMSATLDEELFSKYFAEKVDGETVRCPSLAIPGRTFPIQERYMDDILNDLKNGYGNDFKRLLELDNKTSKDYIASELTFSGTKHDNNANVIIDWKRKQVEESSIDILPSNKDDEDARVPLSLLVGTIAHICKVTQDGSILAFLPGLQELIGARDMLQQQAIFGVNFEDESKYKICLLHSTIPPEEQKKVLEPVPKGCRKIILATNIAETSITVPDVKHVVDTGKVRQTQYDQTRRITKLQCTWISNSNARQRAGRAGRTRKGHYHALYTRERRESLTASGVPELLRSDLQETCLSIKAQGFEEPIADFLAEAIQAPSSRAVQISIRNLQAIEALTADQELTSLGRLLSKLPVHPNLGKMVILGIVFRCLDPIILVSCMSNERSLFVRPLGAKTLAKEAHAKYAGEDSDHLALLHAFMTVRKIKNEVSTSAAKSYAQSNFIHFGTYQSIMSTAEQIEQILREVGLVPHAPIDKKSALLGGGALNKYSSNLMLRKCLLLAGVHPNLGVRIAGRSKSFRTPSEYGVLMHPSSQNAKRRRQEDDLLYAYSTLSKSVNGNALFMRDSTKVTPLMTMLFGGKLKTDNFRQLKMDEWLPFKIADTSDTRYATQLILEFKKALDRMLQGAFESISASHNGSPESEDPISDHFVEGIAQLFADKKETQEQVWVPPDWGKPRNSAAVGT